jgi:hypothetical protein
VPAWKEDKRKEAVNAIADHLRVSQLLADTFRGKWDDGVRIADFRAILDLCAPYSGKLNHLLDLSAQSDIGRSEPVAAGAARLLADRKFGRLLLMIDIGAGTTDFALLRILPPTLGGYVTPIIESEAVNFAGDMIDGLLIQEILAKAEIQEEHRADIVRALRLQGVRRLKQALFESGEITLELQTHEIVTLTKDDFIQSKRVRKFVEQLNFRLKKFLNEVDASYAPLVERPVMVISGGSAKLPFLAELRSNIWTVAGTTTKFDSPHRDNPAAFAKFNETDLSQLSVAIGGAVTDVNERDVQRVYTGVLRPPIFASNTWV